MNVHNALKYDTKLLSAIETATGISHDAEGVVRLGETVTPIIDPYSRPEWGLLRDDLPWVTPRYNQAPVVGEFGYITVGLPVALSPFYLIVEKAWVRAQATNQAFNLCLDLRTTFAATLTFTSGVFCRDTRSGDRPTLITKVLPVETGTGTDPSGALSQFNEQRGVDTVGATIDFQSLPYIIKAGTVLVIVAQTANLGFDGGFSGRLRRGLPGELA